MERGLVLLLMLAAAVLLARAIKRTVLVVFPLLVMLWVLFLVIQLLLVLAHLFLCVLAYYVEEHMCQRLPSVVVV